MIHLPKHITKCVISVGNNVVRRCYGVEEIVFNNEDTGIIVNRDPFVVEQEGRRILFTSKANDDNISGYPYVVLVNRKPTAPLFRNADFKSYEWLKHPFINDELTSDEIAQTWRGKFTFIEEDKANNLPGLRTPQAGAIHAWLSMQHSRKDRATIVMPTGTGKTETMLGIMVAAQCKKILVTVPHDALREQISNKFITLGKLYEFGIVTEDCKSPFVAVINSGMVNIDDWHTIIDNSNVIVSTMALLVNASPEVKQLLSERVTNVFVDEAHHIEASTWSAFFDSFEITKITQFTATPFRNDGRKLKGEFVYIFSLREAQQQGYYQRINFQPVYQIDKEKADRTIARKAVEILRHDINDLHKDHILMARCKDTVRAEQVYACYEEYADLNPVVIHSRTTGKSAILERIKRGEHKIIVCVNMLGEGFDLPQLKVAAIHDEKQSLPITLQFIGRFTRTADDSIGEASFVTNMAYPPMADDIRDLYLKDADWNIIIPGLNDKSTNEQREFAALLNDFSDLQESEIPFQSINPALSTVIYRLDWMNWTPANWENVFTEQDFDYRYMSVNEADDMMIIILGSIERVDWTSFEGIQNRTWNVILLHKFDAGNYKHLYINSSLGGTSFNTLVEELFGAPQIKIDGDVVFRSFHGMNRILVQTFGGRKSIAGDISYKSYVGRDVENGLSEANQGRLFRNNIFASGIVEGERTTHGCSKSGKVWSYRRGNLLSFRDWSHRIGRLIEDPTIDPRELFKHTLSVQNVGSCPRVVPVGVDWDDEIYKNIGTEQILTIDEQDVYLFDATLKITRRDWDYNNPPSDILFQISYKDSISEYRINYSAVEVDGTTIYSYHVVQDSGSTIAFRRRQIVYGDIVEYFNKDKQSPVFFFANGSMLYANKLVELREEAITPMNPDELVAYDWNGIDLNVESMDWPHKQNSIQYYMWQKIQNDYELIFDDDGSGEVADLVGVNQDVDSIYVNLYHLKFAIDGHPTSRIANFYEVCGQAQKSLKWKNAEMNLFHRLIKRVTDTAKAEKRILKGNMELLQQLSQDAAFTKRVKVNLHIVQPGLSKVSAPASADILQLLGVVKNYAFEVCNAELTVYCNL
ncbi:MAG: DEAD/DEAH box helicase family protein [Bacteroidales bacterium]|nr:DEAD/DEAH box helicase family protein [Bacteroidales bacterium]